VLPATANAAVTKTDPTNGGIHVTVGRAFTALDPGRYTDSLQGVSGSLKDIVLGRANPGGGQPVRARLVVERFQRLSQRQHPACLFAWFARAFAGELL